MASERLEQPVTPGVDRRGSGWTPWPDLPRPERRRLAGCAGYLLLLALAFIQPLIRLMLYAAHSELNSQILLVPFIAGYLVYTQRVRNPAAYRSSIIGTVTAAGIGFAALVAGIVWRQRLSINDDLSLAALAFVSFVAAGGFLFLGARWMAARAFPVAFLIFMVPLPDAAVAWLENASMLASAEAAALFFNVSGTPVLRQGMSHLFDAIQRSEAERAGAQTTEVSAAPELLANVEKRAAEQWESSSKVRSTESPRESPSASLSSQPSPEPSENSRRGSELGDAGKSARNTASLRIHSPIE